MAPGTSRGLAFPPTLASGESRASHSVSDTADTGVNQPSLSTMHEYAAVPAGWHGR
jgi:hypothetical protein